ncbi:DUF3995 domain-containing protein [Microbacterium sp. NPDC008134]|uniref:DUF3995 domain-containing protein n=1 Tax=Microbacterium sp. NPDC008134 TaxID=3364183 RepID=UPI0036EB0551
MPSGIRVIARTTSVIGLSSLAALHAIWASGSPWPAQSPKRLAEAVVGQKVTMPSAAPTAVVAAGTAGAALAASGALGNGRLIRIGLRSLSMVMLLRAALGGDAALAALGMPPAGKRFQRLDRRWYRPFAAILGAALWLSSRRR